MKTATASAAAVFIVHVFFTAFFVNLSKCKASCIGVRCEACNEILSSVHTEIPALGHDFTYTAINGQQHLIRCTRCDYNTTEAHSFENSVCICGMRENGIVADPALGIYASSITLQSSLVLNFYVEDEVLTQYEEPYVVFVKEIYDTYGNVTDREMLFMNDCSPTEGVDGQAFRFPGVKAREIGSTVTAILYGTKDGFGI